MATTANRSHRTQFLISATIGYVCVVWSALSHNLERTLVEYDLMSRATELPFLLLATSVICFFPASMSYSRMAVEEGPVPEKAKSRPSGRRVIWMTALFGSLIALVVVGSNVFMDVMFHLNS